MVVCPTRELSAQVAREIRKLGRGHAGLQVLVLSGGEPLGPQLGSLERGVHIVVGTPGRLLDHWNRGTLKPDRIKTVVLDEADRMLDMGFGADVEQILSAMPKQRQTVLFSATFPNSIEEMCRVHQQGGVRITIEEPEEAVHDIEQLAVMVEPDNKTNALLAVFDRFNPESALVFCNFKATVGELAHTLATAGVGADALHGDLDQFHRDQVLAKFRNRSVRVLIATDVAARGLDVEDLELVVNYELPDKAEIYVHRIGRTGRAGKGGRALSLVSARDRKRIDAIEASTGTRPTTITLGKSPDKDVPKVGVDLTSPMDTILISGGRKDKVRAGDILGALTGEAGGLAGTDIGKIEIQDRLSYVAVARRVSRKAVQSLNAGRIKGKRFRATLV